MRRCDAMASCVCTVLPCCLGALEQRCTEQACAQAGAWLRRHGGSSAVSVRCLPGAYVAGGGGLGPKRLKADSLYARL